MGYRSVPFQTNTYYHIYNRGWNKQRVFFDKNDYNHFFDLITKYRKKEQFQNIVFIAYCFLPNHFHFILKEEVKTNESVENKEILHSGEETKNISEFMRYLLVSYAMYFNKRHGEEVKPEKKAPVFEGRFQSRIIGHEDYLNYVHTYVEYNAIKHGLVERPEDWPYSSFQFRKHQTETDELFQDILDKMNRDVFDPGFI